MFLTEGIIEHHKLLEESARLVDECALKTTLIHHLGPIIGGDLSDAYA
ncbi:MAG: hypothetical protein ACWA44_11410 [Thiotrichales bacterium]